RICSKNAGFAKVADTILRQLTPWLGTMGSIFSSGPAYPCCKNAPMYSCIPAKDVARARKFYEEKLGFKPMEVTAGGVVYKFANGTACFLYATPNAGTSHASQAFWQIEDIEGSSRLDGAWRRVREV